MPLVTEVANSTNSSLLR